MGLIPTSDMVVSISTFTRLGRKFENLRPTQVTYKDLVSTNSKKERKKLNTPAWNKQRQQEQHNLKACVVFGWGAELGYSES